MGRWSRPSHEAQVGRRQGEGGGGVAELSVSAATNVWGPWARVDGSKLQAPDASACDVTVAPPPSLIVTVAFGSPPPARDLTEDDPESGTGVQGVGG